MNESDIFQTKHLLFLLPVSKTTTSVPSRMSCGAKKYFLYTERDTKLSSTKHIWLIGARTAMQLYANKHIKWDCGRKKNKE